MKRRRSLLLSLMLLVAIPGIAHAQAWSGILDPTRAIDWTNPGVIGGIQNRTTICATVAAYTGDASAINSAIASCPAGQVVKLGVGTPRRTRRIISTAKPLDGWASLRRVLQPFN